MIFGYIDPAVGATIMQLVVAGFVGIGAVVRLKWQSIRGFFGRGESSTNGPTVGAEISTDETVDSPRDPEPGQ